MKRWVAWVAFIVAAAGIVHWAAVVYAPSLIMSVAMRVMAGRGVNTVSHLPRPDAAWRRIVRVGPDLLYSTCVFDLSEAPLKVTTAAPIDTYWSVSFYADNTDNFFVLNDLEAGGRPATIVLVGEGQTVPPQPEGTTIVIAPSQKGAVLFRTLINEDGRAAELDLQRRAAGCAPLLATG